MDPAPLCASRSVGCNSRQQSKATKAKELFLVATNRVLLFVKLNMVTSSIGLSDRQITILPLGFLSIRQGPEIQFLDYI